MKAVKAVKARTPSTATAAWGDEILRIVPDIERRIATTRPMPPDEVADDVPERFAPDIAFAEWMRETFIVGSAPLENPKHAHLVDARISVLWTNTINVRSMRHILATAEMPTAGNQGGRWKRGRAEQQLRDWFECEPDFLITFYAPEVRLLDDRALCALVEHELLHCAQAEDMYGSPKFTRLGAPIFTLRGHDVEEFTDVVRRYGSTTAEVRELVHAATSAPLIADVTIAKACGTCLARAA